MATNRPDIGLSAGIDLSQWSGNIQKLIRDADSAEEALERVSAESQRLDRAISGVSGQVKLDTDTSDLETAKRLVDDLDSTASTRVTVNDAELDTAKRKRDDLEEGADVPVRVDDRELDDALFSIQELAAGVTVAVAVTGGVLSVAGGIGSGIGQIVELDQTLGELEARTGRLIPQSEELIRELWVDAWGESIGQLGEVVAQADQLGIEAGEIRDAVESVFIVSQLTGEDPLRVQASLIGLVRTGLAEDIPQAADLATAAIQRGLNKNNDLLDTIDEYSVVFADAGFSAEGFFTVLDQGLQEGIFNSDKIADAVLEFSTRLTDFITGPTAEQTQAFDIAERALPADDLTGQLEAFSAGEITGEAFIDGFLEAVRNIENSTERQFVINQFFGSMAEDTRQALTQLDPIVEDGFFSDEAVAGAAARAGQAFNDNLGTAITGLTRTLSTETALILEERFDADVFLDDLKAKINTFSSELRESGDFFDALELTFNAPFLEERISELVAAMLDATLGILFAVDTVANLDFIGSEGLAEDTAAAIARVGELRFELDLAAAQTPEAFARAIDDAVSTGAAVDIVSLFGEAITQALEEGEQGRAERLAAAALQFLPGGGSDAGLAFAGAASPLDDEIRAVQEAGLEARATLESALGFSGEPIDLGLAESIVFALEDPALIALYQQAVDNLIASAEVDIAAGDFASAAISATILDDEELKRQVADLSEDFALVDGELVDLRTTFETETGMIASSVEDLGIIVHEVTVGNSITTDIAAIEETASVALPAAADEVTSFSGQTVESLEEAIGGLRRGQAFVESFTGSVITGFGNALPIVQNMLRDMTELAQVGTIANQVVQNIAAQAGAINAASNTTNINVTNNVTNQSAAQESATTQAIANQLAGNN